MKDVTITVVKSEKEGYRMIVNDDAITTENAEGSKGNDFAFTLDNKGEVQEKLMEIVENLE